MPSPLLKLLKGEGSFAWSPGPEGKTDHVLFRPRLVALLPPERALSWMGSPQTHTHQEVLVNIRDDSRGEFLG
jgi:hypothetical protein